MRRFSSYGPPSPTSEFIVKRLKLVKQISLQLIGNPEDKGHYFTVFAPRQRGKTTTLRSVVEHIRQEHGEQYHVGMTILHQVRDLRVSMHTLLDEAVGLQHPPFESWEDVYAFFSVKGPLKKPVILILDEFDALPDDALQEAITFFRRCYHLRSGNWLHGVALIGVHSSLGKLEGRTSPFNVQRAVNIPNFTHAEVIDLYAQYSVESGQPIAPEGVERIYELFRGQPGLTCWFGELLTEKYNQVQPPPWERNEGPPPEGYPLITDAEVRRVISAAMQAEINTNIRNLISKGMQYQTLLREVFVNHELEFDLNNQDIQWLYLNGILVGAPDPEQADGWVCVFASPFVQRCLFTAFGQDLRRSYTRAMLFNVDEPEALGQAVRHVDVPALLQHYRHFLIRQTAKGNAPWSEQPERSDARAFEAIGHFNLYAWLYGVAKGGMTVVPEFPTGNGTADLWLERRKKGRKEVLEVKSFSSHSDLSDSLAQVRRYARKLKLPRAYLVVMADVSAFDYLKQQPTSYVEAGLEIKIEVIPWGFIPGEDIRGNHGATEAHLTPKRLGPPPFQEDASSRATTTAPRGVLTVAERMALERLVVPLLTSMSFKLIRMRIGLDSVSVARRQLPLHWGEVVRHCETHGNLQELVEVLRFTFPELVNHPLLMKLEAPR